MATIAVAVPIVWFTGTRLQRRAIEPRRFLTHRTAEQVVAVAHAAIAVRGWTLVDAHNPVVFRSPLWHGRLQEIAVLALRSRSGTIVVVAPIRYTRGGPGYVPTLFRSTNRRLDRFEELLHSLGAPSPIPISHQLGVGERSVGPAASARLRPAHGRFPRPDGPVPHVSGHEFAAKPIAIRDAVIDLIDATPEWTLLAVDGWTVEMSARAQPMRRDRSPAVSVMIVIGEAESCGGYALTGRASHHRARHDKEVLALCSIERRLRSGLGHVGIRPAQGAVGCAYPGLIRAAREFDAELDGGGLGEQRGGTR